MRREKKRDVWRTTMMGVETGRIVLHISLETLLALLYTYFSLALEEILTAGSKK